MNRAQHYDEAERLLDTSGPYDGGISMLLKALTHAVLASVDWDVSDRIPSE